MCHGRFRRPPAIKEKMKKILSAGMSLFLFAAPALCAEEPAREILGIGLEMTREDAQKRLKEIGTFERQERKQQEIWKVRDATFSHVIIGADKEGKLRFLTAVAREDADAKRVAYVSVGNLEAARQAGDVSIRNFHYEWRLPEGNGRPATLVVARGRDPKFLTTFSLKRISDAGAAADDL